MRILLVKTSSMGDVIHNLPVASDIARALPGAQIDWCVEGAFADIARLHPAVRTVLPVHIRRWRKRLADGDTWNAMRAFRKMLRSASYDAIIDSQGLIKSAAIARLARGPRWGFDRASAREALASIAYQHPVTVARNLHAVTRNRLLAARALGYELSRPESPEYGLVPPPFSASWLPPGRYAVLLTATSRDDKCWSEHSWRALIAALARRGLRTVLPSGSEVERVRATRIADRLGAIIAPTLTIAELAGLLAHAAIVVGVDTGLTHLAAATGTPTIALYVASDPSLTGVLGAGFCRNLGTCGAAPLVDDVVAAIDEGLA